MIAIFSRVWRKWLWDYFNEQPYTVIRVFGWRSCRYRSVTGKEYNAEFLGWPWQRDNRTQHEQVH